MIRYFGPTLTYLGVFIAHPAAFLIVFCYVGTWLLLSPATFEWHAVATVATWLMTLFIQRAEHRDTQAIHAKPMSLSTLFDVSLQRLGAAEPSTHPERQRRTALQPLEPAPRHGTERADAK